MAIHSSILLENYMDRRARWVRAHEPQRARHVWVTEHTKTSRQLANQDFNPVGVRQSLQSCLTLCDPVDCSPPGSSVHGILQAKHWSGLPCPPPGDLPDPGIELALQADSFPSEPRVYSIICKNSRRTCSVSSLCQVLGGHKWSVRPCPCSKKAVILIGKSEPSVFSMADTSWMVHIQTSLQESHIRYLSSS